MFMLFLLLFFSLSIDASNRMITAAASNLTPTAELDLSDNSPTRITMRQSSSNVFASKEEEHELCDLAVKSISEGEVNLNGHVSPYLRKIIQQELVKSDTVDISSVQVLRRLKDGDLDDHEYRYLRRLVSHAINDAINDRDQQIEESWSRSKSISGMVITGIVTALISALSSVYAEKSK